jgi:hypothetical protein
MRTLTISEAAIIRKMVALLEPRCQAAAESQLPWVRVRNDRHTYLDLAVDGGQPFPGDCPGGALPVRGRAFGDDGEMMGDVILWVADGRLEGIEYAWLTDNAPISLPADDRVVAVRPGGLD